jgi:tRNA pseudouridine38-40 synthase
MSRYFMELAYNGTRYHGWQRQPNGQSVQEVLENALSTIMRTSVSVTGAGRTDAGVHAAYMVAHFDLSEPHNEPMALANHLSRFLPSDIVVYSVVPVDDDTHSRYSAVARRYEYHVTLNKNPFTEGLATRLNYSPDFQMMNRVAILLCDYQDFTSFSKLHTDVKTNNCAVSTAYWEKRGSRYVFTIEADRFLRNMVRAIVGTLLEVGRGKIDEDKFVRIIESRNRGEAGISVSASGLYLTDVKYPENLFKRTVERNFFW